MTAPVLAVFVEPASYKVELIRELRKSYPGSLEIVFIEENMTQAWEGIPEELGVEFLPLGTMAAVQEIRRRLSRDPSKILHLAGWGHSVLLGALLSAGVSGRRIVSDTDTPLPFGERFFKRVAKRMLYPLLFRVPKIFLPAGTRQMRYLEKYGVGQDRIRFGRMTSDVEGIASFVRNLPATRKTEILRAWGMRDNTRTVFLFVGRLERMKRLSDLFDAYLRLRTRRDDVALVVVGGGSLAPLARAMAASHRSIFYLGRLTGDRVREAYAIADVLVLPSESESWGLVVNEAMAAGLPVIASNAVGCCDDLVLPGITGKIVPACAPDPLCEAMLEMASDAVLRSRMGDEARNLIAGWTPAAQARIMIEAWTAVAG